VLVLDAAAPSIGVPGAQLGLLVQADDLDALSTDNALFPSGSPFLLLFSIDRQTTGLARPDPLLIEAEVPYNAFDQAEKGQAAGDQFMSTEVFWRTGRIGGRGPRVANNSLDRNNFDEGGTDFGAQPPTSAREQTARAAQDNVDATALIDATGAPGAIMRVYFSATGDSPSLNTLPGASDPSGAHIFFNPDPLAGLGTELFAAYFDLGLVQTDDIDAMTVFDLNTNGVFDNADLVLFSLAPGSPSLVNIPGASQAAAADVFVVAVGQQPVVLATSAQLGLGAPPDNIDALDYLPCPDAFGCAIVHGIRAVRGDWDDDGHVDLIDFSAWPACMTGPGGGVPPNFCDVFDLDRDIDVDLDDFDDFQVLFADSMP